MLWCVSLPPQLSFSWKQSLKNLLCVVKRMCFNKTHNCLNSWKPSHIFVNSPPATLIPPTSEKFSTFDVVPLLPTKQWREEADSEIHAESVHQSPPCQCLSLAGLLVFIMVSRHASEAYLASSSLFNSTGGDFYPSDCFSLSKYKDGLFDGRPPAESVSQLPL